MDNLVSILVFTPFLAALILAIFLRGDDEAAQRNAKWLAVTATAATAFMALIVYAGFEPGVNAPQFEEVRDWPLGLTYRVGIDAISLPFVMVTALLWPLAVAASWGVAERVRDYIVGLLVGQSLLLGALTAQDLAFFALFFEAALLPILIVAGGWGQGQSGRAALRAVIYMAPGAVLMVVVVMALAREASSTTFAALLQHNISSAPMELIGITIQGGTQTLLILGLVWSLAVKGAIWPFHGWLPALSRTAPAPVLFLATAICGKLAIYAMIRIGLQMTPVGLEAVTPGVTAVLLVGAGLLVLAALAQGALRPAIAYLSGAGMALLSVSLLSGVGLGLEGAVLGSFAHGLSFAGLCGVLVVLEGRLGGDGYDRMGGIRLKQPVLAHMLLLFCVSLFAMPITASFPGHVLALFALAFGPVWAVIGYALALLMMAAAAMSLYRRVALGDTVRESVRALPRLDGRENAMLFAVGGAVLAVGLFPGLVLEPAAPGLEAVMAQFNAATGQ